MRQKHLGPAMGWSALLADVALKELLEAGTCFLVLSLTVHVLNSIIYFDSAAKKKKKKWMQNLRHRSLERNRKSAGSLKPSGYNCCTE